MTLLQLTILIPFVMGFAVLFVSRRIFKYASLFPIFASITVMIGAIQALPGSTVNINGIQILHGDLLSLGLVLFTGLSGLLVTLYSINHIKWAPGFYWSLFCWLLGSSSGVFLAADIKIFILSWLLTGVVLVLMIWQSNQEKLAKASLANVAYSSILMLIGLVALWLRTSCNIIDCSKIPLDNFVSWVIFLGLLVGALSKIGAIPLHKEIPDIAKDIPAPIVAFLIASVDKLLGVYLLKKIVMDWFAISGAGNLLLLIIGSFTIIIAAFKALAQHNFRRLLGYHTISQAGYMILGFGTGNIIGIAGGLLHMFNNAIYKQCLFLGAGIIERETGSSNLEDLGGLHKRFPITFMSFTISILSITGIPLLNGFVSKWMIYQGIVKSSASVGPSWIFWFVAALFGSILTLASFVKILHATFLGQPGRTGALSKERLSWELPALIILPILCFVIGFFPEYTVFPLLKNITGLEKFPGIWQPRQTLILFLLGIIIGLLVYFVTGVKKHRVSETYIGGEDVTESMRVSGVQFYTTIENLDLCPNFTNWSKKVFKFIKDTINGLKK